MSDHFFKYLFVASILILQSACSSDDDDDTFGLGDPCGVVEDIAPAAIVSGGLTVNDCTAEQTFPDLSAGDASFVDEYRVTLDIPGTLTVTMRSTDLDAFLLLIPGGATCENGCDSSIVITTNNNGGGGSDAMISQDLAAGSYGIHANSIEPGTGRYTLETTFTP